jgi:hypothetical protein
MEHERAQYFDSEFGIRSQLVLIKQFKRYSNTGIHKVSQKYVIILPKARLDQDLLLDQYYHQTKLDSNILHCATCQWCWESLSPACTFDLSQNDGHNEEHSDSSLTSEYNTWAVIHEPRNLEVDDSEST